MHIPVLLNEVIKILNPKPGDFIIDGTVGGGGHFVEIFRKVLPDGIILGIDWDKSAIENLKKKISTIFNDQFSISKMILAQGNYADLPEILKKHNLPKVDGLLLDLGLSSNQLERSGRGFSFLRDEPLDMRYDSDIGYRMSDIRYPKSEIRNLTAAETINSFSEKELADIFYKYGEERFSRQIAKKIVEERKKRRILTTFELVEAVEKALPKKFHLKRHPATKVFQALRIFVNDELGNLEKVLGNLTEILKPKGKAAIISFHSLEDRLVKNYFKQLEKEGLAEVLTKKPITPAFSEIRSNPRARSAKLRGLEMRYQK